MAQILIVEDEESLLQTLRYNLSRAGHEVRLSTNGLQALDMIRGNPPELVVLDLMLPGMDGLDLCRAVRAETANPSVAHMPILMLTARDEEIDKVVGLEVGADDYLTKPFSMHELLARVKAQLRRADMGAAVREPPLQLASGDLLVDVGSQTADVVIDSAGPEIFTFDEMVHVLRRAMSVRTLVVHVPPALAMAGATLAGRVVRDMLLTREELDDLMHDILVSHEPPRGATRLTDWLPLHRDEVGRRYASEMERHYRRAT